MDVKGMVGVYKGRIKIAMFNTITTSSLEVTGTTSSPGA